MYRRTERVLARCSDGSDCAVLCLFAGKAKSHRNPDAIVGPTCFWLTCPHLNALIARFERNGIVRLMGQLLQKDTDLLQLHINGHSTYVSALFRHLTPQQRDLFTAEYIKPTRPNVCPKYGNPAVGHPGDMKCVHALAAAALAGAPNPFGCSILHYIMYLDGVLASAASATAEASGNTVSGNGSPSMSGGYRKREKRSLSTDELSDVSAPEHRAGDTRTPAQVIDDLGSHYVAFLGAAGSEQRKRVCCFPNASSGVCKSTGEDEPQVWSTAAFGDLCQAAHRLLVLAEGHEPRNKKRKNRIN